MKKENDYDKAMLKLEQLVNKIQKGELGLEEMRTEISQAMEIIRLCRAKLRNIETELSDILDEEE